MNREKERQKALDDIRENISKYGRHIYLVKGGGYPHYGYTIGLTESLGAELILPGTYFYRLDDVTEVIRSVIGGLSSPVAWNDATVKTDPWGIFTFRRLDITWAKALMLGAFDYYGGRDLEAHQIVPDEQHWTIDVPDLSRPLNETLEPGWRSPREEWRYPVPQNSIALTDLTVLRGGRITEVMRWEEDEWEIFSGPDMPESQRRIIPLAVLLEADKSILPAVHLHVGTGFWRAEDDAEWHHWEAKK